MLKVVVQYGIDGSGREIGEVVTAYPTHRFKAEEAALWP